MQDKNSHKANFIIQRLKLAINLTTDYELAAFLGIATSTLSTWKSRNSLDYELIFAKCEHKGINYHWLLTGEGSMYRSKDEPDPPPKLGLGARLRMARELLGLSPHQMADVTGLAPQLINDLESKKQSSLPIALVQYLYESGIDLNSLFASKDAVVLRQSTVNNLQFATLPAGPCQQCALRDKIIRAQELALQALSQSINNLKNHP